MKKTNLRLMVLTAMSASALACSIHSNDSDPSSDVDDESPSPSAGSGGSNASTGFSDAAVGETNTTSVGSFAGNQGNTATSGGSTNTTSSASGASAGSVSGTGGASATGEASGAGGVTGTTGSDTGAGGAAGDAGDVVDVVDEPEPVIPELAITEYVEGSSNNKAVEVSYVGTSLNKLVHECQLELYYNGSPEAGAKIDLAPLMDPGDPLVICHPNSAPALLDRCDLKDGNISFNGNDTLVIRCGDTVVDAFGQVGAVPDGEAWGAGDLSAVNNTLRRICPVEQNVHDQPFEVGDYFTSVAGEVAIDVFDDLNSFSCE